MMRDAKRSTILRIRRRARQRGAALFVIALVISLLMGIGVYAARSASLSTQASGYGRQVVQTHYVTDYSMMFAIDKLSGNTAAAYVKQALKATDTCDAQALPGAEMATRSCYKLRYSDVAQELNQGCSGQFQACPGTACVPIIPPDLVSRIPGSLGLGNVEADFNVEMTDVSQGYQATGMARNRSNQIPWSQYVTITSTGQVRITNTGGNPGLDSTSSESASTERVRALMLTAPLNL